MKCKLQSTVDVYALPVAQWTTAAACTLISTQTAPSPTTVTSYLLQPAGCYLSSQMCSILLGTTFGLFFCTIDCCSCRLLKVQWWA